MKNILKLIIGIIITLTAIPIANAIYCNPLKPSTDTYKSIYCDIGWNGWKKSNIEIYKIVAEQLGYQDLGYEFVQAVLESYSCDGVMDYIKEEGIETDELPSDIKDLSIQCDAQHTLAESANAFGTIRSRIKSAYDKTKVINETKTKLEYEFKASERFWDGKVKETERASFDLIVDLNLIEQVLFGSLADWVDPDEVFKFPSDDDSGGGEGDGEGEGEKPVETSPGTSPDEDEIDESVSAEETITDGSQPDCVPADDPDADLGDTPGASPNKNCGNGVFDVLLGEQCDDGNNISGDGCSQYCMLEDSGAGTSADGDMCMDSEAVTFKTPSQIGGISPGTDPTDTSSTNDGATGCPPGTFPKKEISITGPATSPSDGVPQNENYPGPFIGGTLKEYPPSNKPRCPEGYSEVSGSASATHDNSDESGDSFGSGSVSATEGESLGINIGGTQYDIKNKEGTPLCIPTEFCASFDDIRSALFGSDWQEDEEKSKVAYSIEALFCVNLIKRTRPETPYRPDEGCVDCHIRAIVDSLYKALDTNVTPLANTTGGFGISNKWGPNLSFDLTTAIKSKVRLALPDPKPTVQKMEEALDQTISKNTAPAPSSAPPNETATERAERRQAEIKKEEEAIKETLQNYRDTGSSSSDQAVFTRIKPLLNQMRDSFQAMQGNYDQITREGAIVELYSKDPCQ